jgi:hypothetical protein
MVTSSRGISLITIQFLPSRTAKSLANSITRVLQIYERAGFIVQTSLMDMEFKKLKDLIPQLTINTTAAREHVGEIERRIRVIKERARGTISVLPYEALPKLMVIELLHFCVMWLNAFPVKSGISEKFSPRELVSRHKLDAKLHCKSPFGAYCEVHTDPDITNTTEPRTRWAICLGPTRNLQGSYKFMSLTTGKKIVSRKFTEMPVTNSVIEQVAKWAKKDRSITGVSVMDKYGVEYKFDDEEDAVMDERLMDHAPYPDISAEAPGIMTEYETTRMLDKDGVLENEPTQNDEDLARMAAENSGLEVNPTIRPRHGEVIDILDDDDEEYAEDYATMLETMVKQEPTIKLTADEQVINAREASIVQEQQDKPRHPQREPIAHRTRSRAPGTNEDYELYVTAAEEDNFIFTTLKNKVATEPEVLDDMALEAVAHFIMMHYDELGKTKKQKKKYIPKTGIYNLTAGLRKFGDRGETAVSKELHQFNGYDVFEPLYADSLTDVKKSKALASLIFLKEKRNGDVKARSCANGSVQREHVAKDEATSPTVGLESVFVTATIDAREKQEVVTIDIPGAFLHATNEDYVIMKMNGTLAELMAKTDPKLHRKYLSDEKGKKCYICV